MWEWEWERVIQEKEPHQRDKKYESSDHTGRDKSREWEQDTDTTHTVDYSPQIRIYLDKHIHAHEDRLKCLL
jgi:hypothetical protein